MRTHRRTEPESLHNKTDREREERQREREERQRAKESSVLRLWRTWKLNQLFMHSFCVALYIDLIATANRQQQQLQRLV